MSNFASESKVKLATAWLGGCSGCHMSLLDMDERLIELAPRVEVCASPLVDVKTFPEVDVTLVEGAIANTDHLETIRTIRERSKLLVALGDCAVTGNVTAMRNAFAVDDILDRAYRQTAEVVVGLPQADAVMPRLIDRVVPLHQVVKVDFWLQGCPPSADQIYELLTAILDGRAPRLERRFG